MKAAALNLPLRQSREISFVWSADVFSVLRALVSVSLGLLLLIHFPCWAAPSVLTASNIRLLFEILQNMFSCALQHLNTTWTLKLLHRDATSLQNKSPRSSQRCVGERSKAARDENILWTVVFYWNKGKRGSLLLLGHADGATTTAGGLGVLAAHTQTAGRETNQVRTSVTKDWTTCLRISFVFKGFYQTDCSTLETCFSLKTNLKPLHHQETQTSASGT